MGAVATGMGPIMGGFRAIRLRWFQHTSIFEQLFDISLRLRCAAPVSKNFPQAAIVAGGW